MGPAEECCALPPSASRESQGIRSGPGPPWGSGIGPAGRVTHLPGPHTMYCRSVIVWDGCRKGNWCGIEPPPKRMMLPLQTIFDAALAVKWDPLIPFSHLDQIISPSSNFLLGIIFLDFTTISSNIYIVRGVLASSDLEGRATGGRDTLIIG